MIRRIGIGTDAMARMASKAGKALRVPLLHVVMLGMTTTGFPNMIAAFGWVEEVITKSGS